MILRSRFYVPFVLLYIVVYFLAASFSAAQARSENPQKSPVADKSQHAQPADVAGDWQVSWEGRLGTEQCTLHLNQDGSKLTGTFQDLHGISQLAGTVDEKKISFQVQFTGKYPFTTRFTGTADGGKIDGTSQAVDVGGGGAFLGHAGEVVHPDHPWKAKRGANQPTPSGQTASNQAGANSSHPNPRAKN